MEETSVNDTETEATDNVQTTTISDQSDKEKYYDP